MNELRVQLVRFANDSMFVRFTDNRELSVPVASFPRLQAASDIDRANWQLIGRGLGIHWEGVDEDLSIENILTAYSRTQTARYTMLPTISTSQLTSS